ncbi:hypothetical protein GUITHDRAFT_120273 [Guillardia theta CCMP2712]|uniref:Uncharacterized protein n=1 Tax=Guillardia theta (strain CCMP2712) TaxID=905079 RepID=L1IBR1_GUITC|nr:hypothetical protein GUITHDRAFT_120273 [Guillardia theta CCMP2712]EKX33527.1 hypothetical protein GUITHDRAFT_120273 [Guillardia theta CCMP2712]|mmetsp:Transcript_52641/g.163348  ORF Transcript_52641/g.163348 Transcript_52641/m.163348 type:complete len:324 (-) Transcript_52641:806-1777(-)|eukprot:XP_005820507.1 hypothetical protein GUITHDRAFT_120273 [Guillardia theta CCMP2712]
MQVGLMEGMKDGDFQRQSDLRSRKEGVKDSLARTKVLKWLIERDSAASRSEDFSDRHLSSRKKAQKQRRSMKVELEKKLSHLEEELQQTKAALKEAKDNEQDLTAKLRTLQSQVQSLNSSEIFVDDKIESARSRVFELKARMESLGRDIQVRSNARDRLASAVKQSNESLEQTRQLLALERQIHSIIVQGEKTEITTSTSLPDLRPSSETSHEHRKTDVTNCQLHVQQPPAQGQDLSASSCEATAEELQTCQEIRALKQLKVKYRSQIAGVKETVERLRHEKHSLQQNRFRWTPTELRQEANKIASRSLQTSSEASSSHEISS